MLVSIIIPCKSETSDITALLDDISRQETACDTEVIRIAGVSPSGKARNLGAEKAKGDILLFLDNDVRLGNRMLIDNMVKHLIHSNDIGIICSSVRIPEDASTFQRRYAREVPHTESPVVPDLTDVSVATSACCAIRTGDFIRIGKFNEKIIRGVDPEFSFRVSQAGLRVVLAAGTWCYHPAPANMIQLMKISFRNGRSVCFVDRFYPALNIDVPPEGITYASQHMTLMKRAKRFIASTCSAAAGGRVLLLSSKLFYTIGYFYGMLRCRPAG